MVTRGIELPFDVDMSRTITSGTSNSRGDDNRFCTNPKNCHTAARVFELADRGPRFYTVEAARRPAECSVGMRYGRWATGPQKIGCWTMKTDIHPKYGGVVFLDTSTGFKFLTRSTMSAKEKIKWEDGNEYPLVKVDISSASHPYYTGKMKYVDSAGRVEKFQKKYNWDKRKQNADKPPAEGQADDAEKSDAEKSDAKSSQA
jgi:large subunit ribosomal protein L31